MANLTVPCQYGILSYMLSISYKRSYVYNNLMFFIRSFYNKRPQNACPCQSKFCCKTQKRLYNIAFYVKIQNGNSHNGRPNIGIYLTQHASRNQRPHA